MSARVLVLLGVLFGGACEVGLPLVDKTGEGGGGKILVCPLPPKCDDPFMELDAPDHPARPIAGCASPQFCQLGDDALGLGGCPPDPIDALPQTAKCQRLSLQVKNPLVLADLDWSEVNLALTADQATMVTLSGGLVDAVHVELRGPIALHVERMQLKDLRVEGSAATSGGPSLVLENFRGEAISVGSREQDFPGNVSLHAVQLADADIRAQAIVIESASLDKVKLKSDTLNVTDLTLSHAKVDAGSGLWSSYGVEDSFLTLCGDTRLVDGDLTRVGLTSCMDSPLRVYNGIINSSTLDGSFELDEVSLNNSRLAKDTPTRVIGFQTHLMSTQLCKGVELFALGRASVRECANCEDPDADPPLCLLKVAPDATVDMNANLVDRHEPLKGNYCAAWQDLDPLPDCDDDLPTRPERRR